MIKLSKLINEWREHGTVWALEGGRFGAKNKRGKVKRFNEAAKAHDYASTGSTPGSMKSLQNDLTKEVAPWRLPTPNVVCGMCQKKLKHDPRVPDGKILTKLCPACKVRYYLGDNKIVKNEGTSNGDDDVESLDVKTEAKERNYKQEYEDYGGKPDQIKRRAGRNAARRKLKKLGRVRKGQDVDHKNHNPNDNKASNLQALSVHKNRGKK